MEGRNGNECASGGVNQGVALSEQIRRQGCIRQEVPLPAKTVNLYEAKRQTEATKQMYVSTVPLQDLW